MSTERRCWIGLLLLVLGAGLLAPMADGAGNCAVWKTWADAEILTAPDLNNSMVTVGISNMIPSCLDDFSANVAQMQAQTDPYPGAVESQPTSLAGEIERLRYQLAQLSGRTYWYQDAEPASVGTLLLNGSVEHWSNGTTSAPDYWTLTGAGSTIARETSQVKHGVYSAAVTRGGTDAYLGQAVTTLAGGATYFKSRTYTAAVWVRATVASRARLLVNDGIGTTASAYHTGSGAFELLTVTRTLSASASTLELRMQVDGGDTTVQFDGAVLVEGWRAPAFTPHASESTPTAGSGARVYNSLNISIPDNTDTALTFDTERYDTADYHSITSNTSRLTVPAGGSGKFLLNCVVQFAANATGDRGLALKVNGATVIARQRFPSSTNSVKEVTLSTLYALAATDYVECLAFQNSTGSLNANNAANYSPEFALTWIGP